MTRKPTTIETLLFLDATLKYLAAQRTEAAIADQTDKAADFDRQWHIFDDDRQNLIMQATDRDLISYEIARG